eukprot:CAMPEP_0196757218 /NCGR_PEP_ID=MMETSP1091-20130531/103545_1 /TAXON_ID=302021 /ORGANISM="Rhodomonas sp., Strain CCMP768" /LENGTH=66 /DNA_ID=CAMNT_0042105981 /DNA_START=166 /DNA_END=363 /DNA_ORIENTATION=-
MPAAPVGEGAARFMPAAVGVLPVPMGCAVGVTRPPEGEGWAEGAELRYQRQAWTPAQPAAAAAVAA